MSYHYCKEHSLDKLDLNLLCVRVKDPAKKLGKDAGYWVGHFQISEELRKKENAKMILEMASAKNTLAGGTEPVYASQVSDTIDAKRTNKFTSTLSEYDLYATAGSVKQIKERAKKNIPLKNKLYRSVLARLIHSSMPIPDSLIAERFYVTVELISLSIPNRLVRFELWIQALWQLFIASLPSTSPKANRSLQYCYSGQ